MATYSNKHNFVQTSTNDYVSNGMFTFAETTTTKPNTHFETTPTREKFITDWVVSQTEGASPFSKTNSTME